MADERQSIVK